MPFNNATLSNIASSAPADPPGALALIPTVTRTGTEEDGFVDAITVKAAWVQHDVVVAVSDELDDPGEALDSLLAILRGQDDAALWRARRDAARVKRDIEVAEKDAAQAELDAILAERP